MVAQIDHQLVILIPNQGKQQALRLLLQLLAGVLAQAVIQPEQAELGQQHAGHQQH